MYKRQAVDDIILVHETPYACAFLSEIICTNSGSDSTSLGDCCEVCDPRPSSFQVVVSGVTPNPNANPSPGNPGDRCANVLGQDYNRTWELSLTAEFCPHPIQQYDILEYREEVLATGSGLLICNPDAEPSDTGVGMYALLRCVTSLLGTAYWKLSFHCCSSSGSGTTVASYITERNDLVCQTPPDPEFVLTYVQPGASWPDSLTLLPIFTP